MTLRTSLALLLALTAGPALAQAEGGRAEVVLGADAVPADVRALHDALELPGIVAVMAQEGEAYGEDLAATLFPTGEVPASWTEAVAAIYDEERMQGEVLAALARELEGEDVEAMTAFFAGGTGASFAALELAAREAMLDEDVEQAAKEAAAVAVADEDPRLDLIRRYADANDMIETNVTGALNTNYAYFMGLMDGGATAGGLTESDVLADVQSQEPQIRADTTEWVYSFLLMAYGPATDEEIEALIAFSETEEGQALNRALFAAFDGVFADISHRLGLASARFMTTQEL